MRPVLHAESPAHLSRAVFYPPLRQVHGLPDLLVAFAFLDPEATVEVEVLPRKYNVATDTVARGRVGKPGTVLLSTHSIIFAGDFATRQGIMRGGHLALHSPGGPAAPSRSVLEALSCLGNTYTLCCRATSKRR